MNANYSVTGPAINVFLEDGTYWATCPLCPGFTAVADDWATLMRFVREFHEDPAATHRGWTMLMPFEPATPDSEGTVR